jgi:hypothetical protein
MSSRRLAALLAFTACLVALGIVGLLEHYSRVASAATLGISGVIAFSTILTLRERRAPVLEAPLDQDQLLVRRKSAITPKEWLDVLKGARSEFYIAGHSLGRWCDEHSHDGFLEELARILRAGGKVTLVFLHPNSEQLPRLRATAKTDYSTNVHRSIELLREFIATLAPEHRARLKISLLNDPLYLPYMLVGNEHMLITATFLASRDSDEMPCLTLDRESHAAVAIYDDFHALANLVDPPDRLPPGGA